MIHYYYMQHDFGNFRVKIFVRKIFNTKILQSAVVQLAFNYVLTCTVFPQIDAPFVQWLPFGRQYPPIACKSILTSFVTTSFTSTYCVKQHYFIVLGNACCYASQQFTFSKLMRIESSAKLVQCVHQPDDEEFDKTPSSGSRPIRKT